MQKLLNLCSKYAVDHSLTYNAKKEKSVKLTIKMSTWLLDSNPHMLSTCVV